MATCTNNKHTGEGTRNCLGILRRHVEAIGRLTAFARASSVIHHSWQSTNLMSKAQTHTVALATTANNSLQLPAAPSKTTSTSCVSSLMLQSCGNSSLATQRAHRRNCPRDIAPFLETQRRVVSQSVRGEAFRQQPLRERETCGAAAEIVK